MSRKKSADGIFTGIGSRIRKIRGIQTQVEFAAALGISQGTVNKYENQLIFPGENILKKICDYGKIPIEWLLHGEEKRSPPKISGEEQEHYESRPAELDSDQLIAAIAFARKYLKTAHLKFTDFQEAHFITYLYEYWQEHQGPPGETTTKRLAELATGKEEG